MGIMDAFNAEDRVQIKFSTMYSMMKAASRSELLMNNEEVEIMAMKQKAFEGLAETIRETGIFLEDNAEALVSNVKFLKCMTIRIEFCPEEYPVVNVDYDAISPEAVAAWGKSHE